MPPETQLLETRTLLVDGALVTPLAWLGSDDGIVVGFETQTTVGRDEPIESDFQFTTRRETSISILPRPDGTHPPTCFFVRAVDDEGLRDPSPARVVLGPELGCRPSIERVTVEAILPGGDRVLVTTQCGGAIPIVLPTEADLFLQWSPRDGLPGSQQSAPLTVEGYILRLFDTSIELARDDTTLTLKAAEIPRGMHCLEFDVLQSDGRVSRAPVSPSSGNPYPQPGDPVLDSVGLVSILSQLRFRLRTARGANRSVRARTQGYHLSDRVWRIGYVVPTFYLPAFARPRWTSP